MPRVVETTTKKIREEEFQEVEKEKKKKTTLKDSKEIRNDGWSTRGKDELCVS